MYNVINYVDCTKEQQREILALRNLDDVRKWMVSPDMISEEDHFRFVESLHGNENRLYFAIYKDGALMGTYNLTNEGEGVWERGIIAKPAMQGKGETAKWECQIINSLPQHGVKTLSAKVKQDNQRSIRYHEKLGYQEQSRDDKFIYYRLNIAMGKTFIVAELSANHGHQLELALESVRAAKAVGADAIKIQTYTADTITLDCDKPEFYAGGLWEGQKLYDLYQQAFTPWEWHQAIFDEARKQGLVCFSTPFDKTAVDFLEELGNPIYKIASFEITDVGLIAYAAKKGKPMVISTGIATLEDIELAVRTCKEAGNDDITLLKCTSSYPAPIEGANLRTMADLKERYGVKIGLSDHTVGHDVAVAAVALGATMVEKHFIIDRSIGGPDAAFSMEKDEFAAMVTSIRNVEKALGQVVYPSNPAQIKGREYSRSLYVSEDVKKGEVITEKNVRSVRPGYGLHPKYLPEVIGKKAVRDLKKGERFSLELVCD